jgi:hypothetical protein
LQSLISLQVLHSSAMPSASFRSNKKPDSPLAKESGFLPDIQAKWPLRLFYTILTLRIV